MNKIKLLALLMITMPCMLQASVSGNDGNEEINVQQTQTQLDSDSSIQYGENLLDMVYSNHTHPIDFGDKYNNYFQGTITLNSTAKELLQENKTQLMTTALAATMALNNTNCWRQPWFNKNKHLTKDKLDMLERSIEELLSTKANNYFTLVTKIQTIELNEAKLKETKKNTKPSLQRSSSI